MNSNAIPRLAGWRAALAVTLAAAAALVACGGGGGDATGAAAPASTTPLAATSASYTLGPIDGFGSVVVGGVRFDDSKATVTDEDGVASNSSALKLGMLVQISGSSVDRPAGTGTAARIRFGSETVGPVGVVDAVASTVVVLGQTVSVTSSTVFHSALAGGLTALTAGMVVEVHGVLDQTTGIIAATRIEPRPSATFYRLRGVVAALDTTTKTFKIGSELISYANLAAADVPSALANGALVRVKLQTTRVAGAWVATRLGSGVRIPDTAPDAHVEGSITAFTSATAFEINGLKVDAANASFPDGATGIVLGARVEVSGAVANGVLVATKVELEDHHNGGTRPLELHGDITSVDATAQTFLLRTVVVSYAGTVTYKNGAATDLAAGKRVEVRGILSADRTKLQAQSIEFAKP